jgi:predicted lipoprotein with Yx(FWY)xxD motif
MRRIQSLRSARTRSARHRNGWRSLAAIVFAALLIVAVSGTRVAAAPSRTAAVASGPAVVMTKTGPAGTYLVDGTGKSLYLFVIDTPTSSMCSGPCAQAWPPLTTDGQPTAGAGVTASMLTTIKRSDGSMQVVYGGHPLYFFQGDTSAGATNGQGLNNFGGLWWLVSPAGKAISK